MLILFAAAFWSTVAVALAHLEIRNTKSDTLALSVERLPLQPIEHLSITTDQQLKDYCEQIATEGEIAFDTEFVSEDTYENHLCLLQIATRKSIAVVDTMTIEDVSPFWDLITSIDTPVIAHAAREEFCFAWRSTKRTIPNLFDIQVAAGMVGMEYPAAYGTLVHRFLGRTLGKGETRTDWRRRPLTLAQTEYALQDVLYLHEIYDRFQERLASLDRTQWMTLEMRVRQDDLVDTFTGEVWRRVSGVSKLNSRALASARELWIWRDQYAKEKNRPARRILRDDLLVELAKRGTADRKRIKAIRGMERRDMERHYDAIGDCLRRASEIPEDECPRPLARKGGPPMKLLTQFLSTSLGAICRDAEIAPQIVGTADDIRSWLAWYLKGKKRSSNEADLPTLASGWRAEIVGKQLDELLNGRTGLSVRSPKADQPLVIKRVEES